LNLHFFIFSDGYLDDLDKDAELKAYCGFDPTADSLQLGNLVAFMGLLRLQAAGNNVIALIGEATSLIGDPTGQKEQRVSLGNEIYSSNSEHFREQFLKLQSNFEEQFLPNFKLSRNPGEFKIMNNMEWHKKQTLLDFLRFTANCVRYQELAHKESVKTREASGSGMSMHEFLYPMLQAYDFAYLYQCHSCNVQLGGNDQIGNIDTGIALIRRKLAESAFGLTVPLLLAPDGTKVGKTTSNNPDDVIWLNPAKLRPFHFYQKLLNLPDKFMSPTFIKCLTFFSTEEIDAILTEQKNNPSRRPAQRAIAQEVTLLVHGAGCLQASELASRVLYASSSVNTTHQHPMLALSEGLTPTERNFLVTCLAHYSAPTDGPLPVIHDKVPFDASPIDRLHEVLKSALSSGIDRGIGLSVEERGLTLNGHCLLKPSPYAVPMKESCKDCKERSCLRKKLAALEPGVIEEAWKAADLATGFSILQIGKLMCFVELQNVFS
uniref:Tyrosine--tRNA ligase n=1 Tax=Rodentolepis nana TaxID=102285 RepID=A0A0R3TN77_RODNA